MKPFYEQRRPVWVYHQNRLDFPLHLHDAIEIVYVLNGRSTVICDSGRLPLGPGDLFLSFPYQVHGYENTQDFEGYMLITTTSVLTGCKAMLQQKQPAQSVVHPTGRDAEDIIGLLQMMYTDRTGAPMSLLQGYSLVLLNKAAALTGLLPRTANSDTLQTIMRYIGEHYREPLTRRELAWAVGYSESHISHLISSQLQVSLSDYITMLRMDDARQLLWETDMPVSSIALSLGFASIRSFNRYFLRTMGMSPTVYRSKHRK